MDQAPIDALVQATIDSMMERTKSKLIAPVLTLGVLRRFIEEDKVDFTDQEMRAAYEGEVCRTVREVLHHSL